MSATLLIADARAQPWLAALDPRAKLAWLLGVSVLSVLVDSTPALLGLCLLGAVPIAGLRMRAAGWLAIAVVLGLTAWSTVLSQALFFQPDETSSAAGAELNFLGLRLTLIGAEYGLKQSLRLLATTLTGLAVCLSTSPERLLAALVRVRVPSAVSFMTVTALRFLPTMLDEYAAVRRARRLRGYRFQPWGPPGRRWQCWQLEVTILLPLVASALRRSAALATSVTSRGFEPGATRTFYPELRMQGSDRGLLAAMGTLCAAVAGAKTMLWLAQGGVYVQPALQGLYTFAERWL